MADDHAANAISAYGSKINTTPNIDRIGNEGIRLDHCYVTNSICTPSRAAILTGTYNHVNRVTTLKTHLDNRLPNVAKHLQVGGYQTAVIGKWHLGEGHDHQPAGFDFWSVLPGQGDYFDPEMIEMGECATESGYITDIITEKSLKWLQNCDPNRPFFLMCHHKAPHREWEPHPNTRHLYTEKIAIPKTFDDDYCNRGKAAAAAKMRVKCDMTYDDLGLLQPEGGNEIGEPSTSKSSKRKVPSGQAFRTLKLIDKDSGEIFEFQTERQLEEFKYQRYLQRYLRTVASIDDSVGKLLAFLDENDLAKNTIVIYTSDQGFFLGEHGWFDKRFMYEQSFQMPFLARFPEEIKPGSFCENLCCNVDFAPTFLDLAALPIPSYMQGKSILPLLQGRSPKDWKNLAYHRYWMHRDPVHNAYAHYGIRNERYKLIYWYNEGLGQPGTLDGGEKKEWELFDCELDPFELLNVYEDPAYNEIRLQMMDDLDQKMAEIGDLPVHGDRL